MGRPIVDFMHLIDKCKGLFHFYTSIRQIGGLIVDFMNLIDRLNGLIVDFMHLSSRLDV